MSKKKIILHLAVLILFVLELISRLTGNDTLEFVSKPWLMVWITVYFILYSQTGKDQFFIIGAFFFSWAGDMLLMFANSIEILFYAGVGGFFIAQLFYIRSFLGDKKSRMNRGFLFNKPVWIIPFVIYLGLVLLLVSDGIEGVMIPVIVIYAISLVGMSMAALNRRGLVSHRSFAPVFAGSVLFVLSDSMIAINRFYQEFAGASFFIMLTYFIAQYLIMAGLLARDRDVE